MSKNPPGILTFTPEELSEHDLDVAMEAQQIVVDHLVKDFNKMTAGQIVRAAKDDGKDVIPLDRDEMRAAREAARIIREAKKRRGDK
ncbi:hypothetical protein [Paraburkholderia sacchari]|uniref:hypothetical protein n=1 Tax=Paraburkholderia sacchari TaxID=159450 RepID=UPI001BCCAC35|nr:hypothetical protein [Paraburkholderia sacchari]